MDAKSLSSIQVPKLPVDRPSWAQIAKKNNLKNVSIFGGWALSSASEMVFAQAFLMRVILPPPTGVKDIESPAWDRFIYRSYIVKAKEVLSKSLPFGNYLKLAPKARRELSRADWESIGAFSITLNDQLLIRRNPMEMDYVPASNTEKGEGEGEEDEDGDEQGEEDEEGELAEQLGRLALRENKVPVKEDEQVVNSFLHSFTHSVTLQANVEGRTSLTRIPFVIKDCDGKKAFEARVDGTYRAGYGGDLLDILICDEVKRDGRMTSNGTRSKVQMQEAGEVFGWINNHPPKPWERQPTSRRDYQRVLRSQCKTEHYIIFATFPPEYAAYAQNIGEGKGFMTMNVVGPFYENNPRDLETMATALLGYIFQYNGMRELGIGTES